MNMNLIQLISEIIITCIIWQGYNIMHAWLLIQLAQITL